MKFKKVYKHKAKSIKDVYGDMCDATTMSFSDKVLARDKPLARDNVLARDRMATYEIINDGGRIKCRIEPPPIMSSYHDTYLEVIDANNRFINTIMPGFNSESGTDEIQKDL